MFGDKPVKFLVEFYKEKKPIHRIEIPDDESVDDAEGYATRWIEEHFGKADSFKVIRVAVMFEYEVEQKVNFKKGY